MDCLLVNSLLTRVDLSSLIISLELVAAAVGLGGGVRRRLLKSTWGPLAAGVFGTMKQSTLTVLPVLAKTNMLGLSYLNCRE